MERTKEPIHTEERSNGGRTEFLIDSSGTATHAGDAGLRRKKTFVAFEQIKGRPSIAFRLESIDVELLLRCKQFFVTPYGRGQWVSAWADVPLDWRLVNDLLRRSYRLVALKRMIAALDHHERFVIS